MHPGHIPIITRHTLAFTARQRLIMWRIRQVALLNEDAPDLFRHRSITERIAAFFGAPPADRQRTTPSSAAGRRARSLPIGRGTFLRRALRQAWLRIRQAAYFAYGLPATAVGLALVMSVPFSIAVLMATASPTQEREPACHYQWASDLRWIEHCNHHDGQGFVERKDP
jgi:hypothetical protein